MENELFFKNIPDSDFRVPETPDIMAELVKLLAIIRESENNQIEKALEAAVQGGEHGVLVVRDRMQQLISAEVSEFVPYGTIYIIQKEQLYDRTLPPPIQGGAGT